MFLLGLLLPIAYIAGVTGKAMATQWALLSIVLPYMIWRRPPAEIFLHKWFAWFFAWAALTATWAPQTYDAIYGLWVMVLWALCFQLGLACNRPTAFFRGLAWGLYINLAVAIAQWLGYSPVEVWAAGTPYSNIAGLLYNRTVFGAACALVALGLIEYRYWYHAIPLVYGILLSGSRGAALAFVLALVAHWSKLWAIAGLSIAACLALALDTTSDNERLQAWIAIAQNLTMGGHGPWSTTAFIMVSPSGITQINAVHNDFLQLAFEFGIFCIIPIGTLALALVYSRSLVVWGYAILACFWFPTYNATTAAIALFALGNAFRCIMLDGILIRDLRFNLHSSLADPEPTSLERRSGLIPVLSRTEDPL